MFLPLLHFARGKKPMNLGLFIQGHVCGLIHAASITDSLLIRRDVGRLACVEPMSTAVNMAAGKSRARYSAQIWLKRSCKAVKQSVEPTPTVLNICKFMGHFQWCSPSLTKPEAAFDQLWSEGAVAQDLPFDALQRK